MIQSKKPKLYVRKVIPNFAKPPRPDLYPQDDALSAADLNSKATWTQNGAALEINAGDTAEESRFSFSIASYVTGGQDYIQRISDAIDTDKSYEMNFWSKFIPGGLPGAAASCRGWLGVVTSPNVDLTGDLTWTEHTVQFHKNQSNVTFRFWVCFDTHDSTGDVLMIDKVSIYEVPMKTPTGINVVEV